MLVAVDFDRTFTLDPALWSAVIRVMRPSGHRVIMVTCRTEGEVARELIQRTLEQYGVESYVEAVICTTHSPKRVAAEARGYRVDVWIDDLPEVIGAADAAEVAQIERKFNAREA